MIKRIIFSIIALIILGIIYLNINSYGIFNNSYETIDIAIKNSDLKGYNIITKLEDNNCAFVLVGKNESSQWEYFYKDSSGWQHITKNVGIPKKLVIKDGYYLSVKYFRGKNIINVTITSKYSESWEVNDSIDSNFKTDINDFGKDYFVVLDDLPKNYTIFIDGHEYKIN